MKLRALPASDAHRIVPLLQDLHALHVTHQPDRYPADPCPTALAGWLQEWLSDDQVTALIAEDPQGTLLGYLIWDIEDRPALPISFGGRKAMVHHVAVAAPFRQRGVGRALMQEMRAQAMAQGADRIATTYAPFNAASAALMASQGLEPVMTVAEWRAPKGAP